MHTRSEAQSSGLLEYEQDTSFSRRSGETKVRELSEEIEEALEDIEILKQKKNFLKEAVRIFTTVDPVQLALLIESFKQKVVYC